MNRDIKHMIKKLKQWVMVIIATFSLVGCHAHHGKNRAEDYIRVGVIAGPEAELMREAQAVALKKYGLKVKIVEFTDYNMPNQALEDDQIDANAFQHSPFLLAQVRAHGYAFAVVGKTFLYPMGLYSKTITSLSQLSPGSKISVPNDPSNEARALLLLQQAKLIQLKPHITVNATIRDIAENPHHYQIVPMDAAQLPRTLRDVALSAINTNYAELAGLTPTDALYLEKKDSPYMNLMVVRTDERDLKRTKEWVKAYQSQAVLDRAKALFGDGAVPGFTLRHHDL